MARSPLSRFANRWPSSRSIVGRAVDRVTSSLSDFQALKLGGIPSPLLLTVRAANRLAQSISEQPKPIATPGQRRALKIASLKLRALTRTILPSLDARDPQSLESELTELITRTLWLIDRVTADDPAIAVSEVKNPTELGAAEPPETAALPPGNVRETD